jgi:sulfite reductase (NADPH) flavoprotein alpha-component
VILTTGRVRDHWHTLTRTAKSPALTARTPEPILDVHPQDARRVGVHDGDVVEITSRRGTAIVQCRVSETIRAGTCFLPFHWGRQFGFFKSANNLTLSARDLLSQQPELKACAVRLRRLPDPDFEIINREDQRNHVAPEAGHPRSEPSTRPPLP